ncbi:hypothetical protein QQS21_008603 [Conoideocrella luteorostrata]|uniref:SP-RING-type domain-containing protein n=1 Tax=Conoideocrella luteorostrata TaxID=1105319 RepID=A0AAJ0CIV4_9HYPO|nr:hypothetical protein QQS21_008603 [Conoideocrella luteorostrata]
MPRTSTSKEKETASTGADEAAERRKILIANETSRAFIGRPRHSWMTSTGSPDDQGEPTRKSSRPKRTSAPLSQNSTILPGASAQEKDADAQQSREILRNSSEMPAILHLQKPPSTSSQPASSCAAPATFQEAHLPSSSENSPRTMPTHPSTQQIDGAATDALPRVALPEGRRGSAYFRPILNAPTMTEQGESQDSSQPLDTSQQHPGTVPEHLVPPQPAAGVSTTVAHSISIAAGGVEAGQPSPSHQQRFSAQLISLGNPMIWRQILVNHVARFDGPNLSINALENWRYGKLIDASERNDAFYIALHKIFCQWTHDKTLLPVSVQSGNQNFGSAFDHLNSLLMPNDEINQQHMAWLMTFPWNLTNPARPCHFSDNMILDICKFLNSFSQNWPPILCSILSRRYPILVHELTDTLDCPSPVLQALLFSASWKVFGHADEHLSRQLNIIHEEDRQNEKMSRTGSNLPVVFQQRSVIMAKYISILNPLVNSQKESHGTANPPPMVLGSSPSATNSQGIHPVPTTGNRNPSISASSPSHVLPLIQRYPSNLTNRRVSGVENSASSSVDQMHAQGPVHVQYQGQRISRNAASVTPTFSRSERYGQQTGQIPPQNPSSNMPYLVPTANVVYSSGPNHPRMSQSPMSTIDVYADWQRSFLTSANTPMTQTRAAQVWPNSPVQGRNSSVTPMTPARMTPTNQPMEPQQGFSTTPLAQTEYPQTPYDWKSVQFGLHLVRSRSPSRFNPQGAGTRYYQFFDRFAVEPTRLSPQMGLQSFEFMVTEVELSRKSQLIKDEGVRTHHVRQGDLRYRLRLSRLSQNDERDDTKKWSTYPSVWPAEIYIIFNGVPVFPRRRQHFHHDLPIELTELLQIGVNTIKISLPRYPKVARKQSVYHLAVEVIVTADHASTLSMVHNSQKISSHQTRQEIQKRLQPASSDDIIVEDDSLCLSLCDPFSASLFQTPVRGLSCKHIECFDLETWLQTRRGKPSQSPTEPSLVDGWKCPICNEDARPPNIRIDEFFLEVLKTLFESHRGQTRSIKATLDGSWTANEEPDDDDDDDDNKPEDMDTSIQGRETRRGPTIIEIEDD